MKHTLRLLLCLVVATMASANIFAAVGDIFTANVGGVDMRFYIKNSDEVTVYGESTSVVAIDKATAADIVIPGTVEYDSHLYKVTSVGQNAFYQCASITGVTIGENVQSLGKNAFQGCSAITHINFEGDDLTTIGQNTFRDCTNLTSIAIPASVETIGTAAFYACKKLTRVDITDLAAWCDIDFSNVTSTPFYTSSGYLPRYLYLNGTLIEELDIPVGVTTIKGQAFRYIRQLTQITIPASVTYIGAFAFGNNSNITDIYCESNTPATLEDKAFGETSSEAWKVSNFHVSFDAMATYNSTSGWNTIKHYVTELDETTLADGYAYSNTNSFTRKGQELVVNYTRNFKNDNWQPLYLPCNVEYEDISSNYEIMAILNDQSTASEKSIKTAEVTSGMLVAGKPYLIRAKTYNPSNPKQTMSFNTYNFVSCDDATYNPWVPTGSDYTFHGVYTETVGLKTNGGWAMNGGKLSRPSSDAVKLLPFRWYVVSSGASSVKGESILLDIMEGEYEDAPYDNEDIDVVDGIEQLSSVDLAKSNIWYTLDGQRIARPTKKGLYIKNGKKVLF